MNRLWLVIFCTAIVFFARIETFAQGEAAVPFLLLAPDSRFSGLGESGAGLADNSSAIFWNPAGIAFLDGTEFCFTHSNWLPQFKLDLFYDYATFRYYMPELEGSLTASITYMNYGEFVRTGPDDPTPLGTFRSFDAALTVGYATKVADDWGLGANFRIIHSRLSDQPTGEEQGRGVSTSVSFDLGTMWRPSADFSVGLNISNMGPKIFYIDKAQADPIPTNMRLGFAYQYWPNEYNSLTATLDFSRLLIRKDTLGSDPWYQAVITSWKAKPFKEMIRDIVTTMGVEYWYTIPQEFAFAARAGFFYEDPSYGNRKFFTFGAGIRYDLYGFDFSYISTSFFKGRENHPLSDTLRFTILVLMDNTPQKSQGLPRGF